MSIITISHEAFGDGRAVAERVADILGYRCISREVLIEASQRYGIAEAKFFEILEEKPPHRTQEERPGMKACFQPLGVILPVNDWATILPSRTTNVSVPISYTLSAVSAAHRM
jgi:Cytidylate kinase-like family